MWLNVIQVTLTADVVSQRSPQRFGYQNSFMTFRGESLTFFHRQPKRAPCHNFGEGLLRYVQFQCRYREVKPGFQGNYPAYPPLDASAYQSLNYFFVMAFRGKSVTFIKYYIYHCDSRSGKSNAHLIQLGVHIAPQVMFNQDMLCF